MRDELTLRVPPHSIEAEQSVLGGLLRNCNAIDRIGDLREEHFYRHDHRLIFAEVMRLLMANKPADVITVFESLQQRGKAEDAGGLPHLNQLAQSMPTAANIRHHADIVLDRAMRRALIATADELAAEAFTSAADVRDLVGGAQAKLEQIEGGASDQQPERAIESMARFIEQVSAEYEGETSPAVATGFADLDAALNGGPRRGNLFVIAGRPKMGKTTLALNIANNCAGRGETVAVFSMEMSKQELHARNVSSIGRIPMEHVVDPKKLTDEDWSGITRATIRITDMPLYLDDRGGLSLMQIRSKAHQIKRKAGALDLVVIDYLQLMSGPGDNRNAQIEAITRGLKALAKDLDCVIILLSQLNRELEKRPNKRPQPSDLRDSGSIEQDCDIAIFLYRDEVYYEDSRDKGVAEANIGLYRQGAAKTVFLTYLGHYMRFEDVARNWHPAPPKSAPAPARGFTD